MEMAKVPHPSTKRTTNIPVENWESEDPDPVTMGPFKEAFPLRGYAKSPTFPVWLPPYCEM